MSNFLETIDSLESKFNNLVERYLFLKEENEILLTTIEKIQQQVSLTEEELLQEREKYRLLKIAKTMSGGNEDSKETKQKINALIREIDKCIVKLDQ